VPDGTKNVPAERVKSGSGSDDAYRNVSGAGPEPIINRLNGLVASVSDDLATDTTPDAVLARLSTDPATHTMLGAALRPGGVPPQTVSGPHDPGSRWRRPTSGRSS
jgi:hypothetical protein